MTSFPHLRPHCIVVTCSCESSPKLGYLSCCFVNRYDVTKNRRQESIKQFKPKAFRYHCYEKFADKSHSKSHP